MSMHQTTSVLAEQHSLYESKNLTRRWLHCSRRDWILDALGRVRTAKQRALEVGPGSGVYLPRLLQAFDYVVAVDIESEYLEHLRPLMNSHPSLTVMRDDITTTSLEPESFDLVLCTEVIEHVTNSDRVMNAIFRLLRPDGIIILTTPHRYSALELCMRLAYLPGVITLVRNIYREPVLDSGHINLLTAYEVQQSLSRFGFVIEESHASGMYLPIVAEFGGELGQRLQMFLEPLLRDSPLRQLLWTQYYVARKPK